MSEYGFLKPFLGPILNQGEPLFLWCSSSPVRNGARGMCSDCWHRTRSAAPGQPRSSIYSPPCKTSSSGAGTDGRWAPVPKINIVWNFFFVKLQTASFMPILGLITWSFSANQNVLSLFMGWWSSIIAQ